MESSKTLLIEDNKVLLYLVQQTLKVCTSSSILTATSLKEATQIWQCKLPKIVISDYHLRAGTSLRLLKTIHYLAPHTKVIIMSTDELALDFLKTQFPRNSSWLYVSKNHHKWLENISMAIVRWNENFKILSSTDRQMGRAGL